MNDVATGVSVSFSQCLCLGYLFLNRPFLNFLNVRASHPVQTPLANNLRDAHCQTQLSECPEGSPTPNPPRILFHCVPFYVSR